MQLCLTGVFRAVGNTTLPMILTLVSQWVIQFPLAYILSHNTSLGKVGIWWAFPISSVVTGLITLVIYAKGDWKKERLTGKTNKLIDKVEKEIVKEGFESEIEGSKGQRDKGAEVFLKVLRGKGSKVFFEGSEGLMW